MLTMTSFTLRHCCLGILLFLAGCASQPLPPGDEQLIAQPPTNWQAVYVFNNETTRIAEYVPPGENNLNWQTKISFEAYQGQSALAPEVLLRQQIEQEQNRCSFIQHKPIINRPENGYPTAVHLMLCGEVGSSGFGQVRLMKAIQGQDNLYLLQLTRNLPAFEPGMAPFQRSEMAAWSRLLSQPFVCDDRIPDRACPDT